MASRGDLNWTLLTTNIDLTLVGLVQPEQDIHQGGFAGAVLPEDGVDLACFYLKIYGIIRDDPGEPFCDSPCLQDRLSPFYPFQEHFLHLSLLPGCLPTKDVVLFKLQSQGLSIGSASKAQQNRNEAPSFGSFPLQNGSLIPLGYWR